MDDDHTQRWQSARKPARHTQKVATDILRYGHQSDTIAVAAVATVATVRHITTAATALASATQQRRFRRFPIRPTRRRTSHRLAVHIPLEHRRYTITGRFPEPARRICRRWQ